MRAILGQTVEVRGVGGTVPLHAKAIAAVLVSHEQQDIGPIRGGACLSRVEKRRAGLKHRSPRYTHPFSLSSSSTQKTWNAARISSTSTGFTG
jgi:hypothetical protein